MNYEKANLWEAFDLWWVMRVVGVDYKGEGERAALVHPCHTSLSGLCIRERKRDAPSSGVMVSVKLSRSAGSGKFVCIVAGKSSSVRSVPPCHSPISNQILETDGTE